MVTPIAVLTLILSGLSFGVNGALAAGEEVEAMHGIRNEKCANTEEEAKNQVFETLQSGRGLCPAGVTANQVDGWTCRKGYDCKKNRVRCNTQYKCGGSAISIPVEARDPVMPKPMGNPSGGSMGGDAAGGTSGNSSPHLPLGSNPSSLPTLSPATPPNMKPLSSAAPKFALPTPTAAAAPWPTATVVPSSVNTPVPPVSAIPSPSVTPTTNITPDAPNAGITFKGGPSSLPAELSKMLPFPLPTALSTNHPADNIQ